jgi:Spy/CpxP family protein refolding chaperone
MKKFNFSILVFAILLISTSFLTLRAQDENTPNQMTDKKERPSLLSELDLLPDQIQQIRRINREKQPLIRAARMRMKEANSALDQAIYDDLADETIIQTRLKEAQTAQAEFTKIRSLTEYAVRKVLSPEQLVKFREVRLRFMSKNEFRSNERRRRRQNTPNQRFNKRLRKFPPND